MARRHRTGASAAAALLLAASAPLSCSALTIDWSCCDNKYEPMQVTQGDMVVFENRGGTPTNVWQFWSKEAYDSCDFDQATYQGEGGLSLATPDAGVTMYFASRNPGPACRFDEWPQKVQVFVEQGMGAQGGQGNTGQGDVGGGGGAPGGTGDPIADYNALDAATKKALKKKCKVKMKKKKKYACANIAQAGGHLLGEVAVKSDGNKGFKFCDKECKFYGTKKSKVNPTDLRRCFGWEHDDRDGRSMCRLYDTVMFKGSGPIDDPADPARLPISCGEFKFAKKDRSEECGWYGFGMPAQSPWFTPKVSAASPAMSMARPGAASGNGAAATFEKFEGSKCQVASHLGMVVKSDAEACEAKCGLDVTCLGYEFDPDDPSGGRCKLLAEEPSRGEKAAHNGHLCAVREAVDA